MPSLVRFLTIIAIVAALIYAAMFALATLVTPRQSEMSEKIDITIPEAPPKPVEPQQP